MRVTGRNRNEFLCTTCTSVGHASRAHARTWMSTRSSDATRASRQGARCAEARVSRDARTKRKLPKGHWKLDREGLIAALGTFQLRREKEY